MPRFGTTPRVFGGFAIDRSYFQRRLPDLRWVLRTAGLIDSLGNTATLELGYVDDSGTFVPLTGGVDSVATAGPNKFTLGPALLFNPVDGYPLNEFVPMVRLRATMDAGVGQLELATIWLEQFAGRT